MHRRELIRIEHRKTGERVVAIERARFLHLVSSSSSLAHVEHRKRGAAVGRDRIHLERWRALDVQHAVTEIVVERDRRGGAMLDQDVGLALVERLGRGRDLRLLLAAPRPDRAPAPARRAHRGEMKVSDPPSGASSSSVIERDVEHRQLARRSRRRPRARATVARARASPRAASPRASTMSPVPIEDASFACSGSSSEMCSSLLDWRDALVRVMLHLGERLDVRGRLVAGDSAVLEAGDQIRCRRCSRDRRRRSGSLPEASRRATAPIVVRPTTAAAPRDR